MSRPDEALLWQRYETFMRAWEIGEFTDDENNQHAQRQDDMILEMLETPASSPAGPIVKLKAALLDLDEELRFTRHLLLDGPEPGRMDVSRPLNLIWSAIRDLERMAQEARA